MTNMTLDDLKKIIDTNWEQNARLNTIEEEDVTKRYLYITGLTSMGVDEEGEPYTLETAIAAHEDDETYIQRLAWNIPGMYGIVLDGESEAKEKVEEEKTQPEPEPVKEEEDDNTDQLSPVSLDEDEDDPSSLVTPKVKEDDEVKED